MCQSVLMDMMTKTNEPTIGDFMTPRPCTISESLSLADAMDRMLANNIRHLVVVRGRKAIGALSAADLSLANAIREERLREIPVSQATRGMFRCAPRTELADVVRTMEAEHFDCVVVADDDFVVGIFTTTDALRALRELALGQPAVAQTTPTHDVEHPAEREMTPPRARAKHLVARRGATPSTGDGLVLGTVGL